VIDEIKHRKAPGWDNISGESIKYGKLPLTITLTKLFNLITRVEYIPIHFKIGQIITIPKINKDKSNQDNYRGITLLPVIAKLYEKCIMKRMEKWAKRKGLLCNYRVWHRRSVPACTHLCW